MDNNSANISKTNSHLSSQTIEHKIDNDIFMSNYNIRWIQYTTFTDCPLELVIAQVTEVDIFKYNPINSSCFLNPKLLTDYSLSFNRYVETSSTSYMTSLYLSILNTRGQI